jgi:hypothetical protein
MRLNAGQARGVQGIWSILCVESFWATDVVVLEVDGYVMLGQSPVGGGREWRELVGALYVNVIPWVKV